MAQAGASVCSRASGREEGSSEVAKDAEGGTVGAYAESHFHRVLPMMQSAGQIQRKGATAKATMLRLLAGQKGGTVCLVASLVYVLNSRKNQTTRQEVQAKANYQQGKERTAVQKR
jgi:hypothetical protein